MARATTPICDVHAHYLAPEIIPRVDHGQARVHLGEFMGVAESIFVNDMPTGATIHQLSSVVGIVDDMREHGLEQRVLSTPPFTFRYWEDAADGADLCRALNDTLGAVVAEHDEFVGLCTVPLQDTDAAIREFERATRDLGFTGVAIGTFVGDENVSSARLEPFYAAVEDAGAPILVHPDFKPNPRLADYYLVNLVGLPVETATTLSNIVFSGLLDRHPDLRFCFLHGGGAAPYLYGRWKMAWRVRPDTKRDTPRPPEDYLGLVYCDTLTHSPEALRYLVDVTGAERVVLGTDNPFDVRDPDPRGHLKAAGISDEERDTIERKSPFTWLHGHAPEAGT